MKFLSKLLSLALAATFLCGQAVLAEENVPAKWQENVPILSILYDTSIHGMYEIYYKGASLSTGDNFSRFEKIHLLMVNGGFVPHNNIIIKNNRTMVPTSVIEDVFGAMVYYDDKERTVNINIADTNIVFGINIGDAEVNGKRHDIEASAFFRDSKIYVPLRFVAEALGAEVQYNNDLLFGQAIQAIPIHRIEFYGDYKYFDVVSIDTGSKDKKTFTVEDGIDSLKKAATEMYGKSHMYYYSSRDYDMHDIKYTNHDLGRYYVYVVKGYENEPVYFNKYTGEIFSSPGGSIPFFIITEGFLYKPAN